MVVVVVLVAVAVFMVINEVASASGAVVINEAFGVPVVVGEVEFEFSVPVVAVVDDVARIIEEDEVGVNAVALVVTEGTMLVMAMSMSRDASADGT